MKAPVDFVKVPVNLKVPFAFRYLRVPPLKVARPETEKFSPLGSPQAVPPVGGDHEIELPGRAGDRARAAERPAGVAAGALAGPGELALPDRNGGGAEPGDRRDRGDVVLDLHDRFALVGRCEL